MITTNLCVYFLPAFQTLLYYLISKTTTLLVHSSITEAYKKLNIFYNPFNPLEDIRLH